VCADAARSTDPARSSPDGMLYVTSGYVSLIGRPGHVLLAFGVD
jgi:hypothetical protein